MNDLLTRRCEKEINKNHRSGSSQRFLVHISTLLSALGTGMVSFYFFLKDSPIYYVRFLLQAGNFTFE